MMFDAIVKENENEIEIPQKDVDFIKGIPSTSLFASFLIFVSQTSYKARTGTLTIKRRAFSSKSSLIRSMEWTWTSKA